ALDGEIHIARLWLVVRGEQRAAPGLLDLTELPSQDLNQRITEPLATGDRHQPGVEGNEYVCHGQAFRGAEVRVGKLARTIARRSDRLHGSPATARAWTSTLPIAVASTGPATTGSPQASAVAWQSSSLRAPPPNRCTTSMPRPDSRAASWIA